MVVFLLNLLITWQCNYKMRCLNHRMLAVQGEGMCVSGFGNCRCQVRNMLLHQGLEMVPDQVAKIATSLLHEFREAQVQPSHRLQADDVVKWVNPPPDVLKINVDASVVKNVGCGVGVVCRNSEGAIVVAVTAFYPNVFDPAMGEAIAAIDGLKVAAFLSPPHLILESDCSEIINELNSNDIVRSPTGIVTGQGREMLCRFLSVEFNYVRRQGNSVAHELAAIARLRQLSCIWYSDFPSVIVSCNAIDNI